MATDPNQLSPEEQRAFEKSMRNLSAETQKQLESTMKTVEGRRALVDLSAGYAQNIKNASEYLSEEVTDLQKVKQLFTQVDSIFIRTLISSKAFNQDLTNNVKIKNDFASLLRDETQVMSDIVLKQAMIGTGLRDEYAQTLATFMIQNKEKNLNDEKVVALVKELKLRQEAKDQLDKQLELIESLAAYQVNIRKETEKLRGEYGLLGAKIRAIVYDKEFQKVFVKGLLLNEATKKAKEFSEVFDGFRKQGLTVTQAFNQTGVAAGAMFSLSGASMKENQEIMAAMSDSMGTMDGITTDTVVEVGKLATTLGVSAAEAGKLQGQLMNMPGATAESATNTMKFAGSLAKAANVAPGKVMKDMASNAEAIALNTKNGGKDMAVVSVAAHKLGVEMASLVTMSAGLLNFETSINKQMEASVLLGKEINLDKAREAALEGDILGATKEMLKNIGGQAEFNKMNVVQRKALADAMGLSVQDLSKLVKNQDKLNNLTAEQSEALRDGSMSVDEVLANSGGVAKNLWSSAAAAGGTVVGVVAMVKGLRDGLSITKDLIGGFKEGSGIIGKFKGGITGAFKAPPVAPTQLPAPNIPGGGNDDLSKKAGFLEKLQKVDASKIMAVGVALLLVGAAIAVASLGLAELVKSFKGLSGPEMFGALAAILIVMGGFVAIIYAMGPAILALGAGAGVAAGPLLALGAAFLMIGLGIGLATYGVSLLIDSISKLNADQLAAVPKILFNIVGPMALLGISLMMMASGLAAMAATSAAVMPLIGSLITLAGVAAVLGQMGGLSLPSFGDSDKKPASKETSSDSSLAKVEAALVNLVNAIKTIPAGKVFLNTNEVGTILAPIIAEKINLEITANKH